MITLRIIDTNNNNYFPQKIENLSFKNIHYGGNSELNFKLNEDPSFQNHKVGLFNNIYLYYHSNLIWQGNITEFQRDYKNLNYNLRASGLLTDFTNKRIKKTYVLDDIGDFRNWNEKNNKQSDEILYGYSQATDEKGVKISLLQRNYVAEEDGLFELKIDENIERLKARVLINQLANFTTKLVTLDENHSNPYTEKSWANAQKIDEDVILDIIKTEIDKEVYAFNFASDDGKWTLVGSQIAGGVLDITANDGWGNRSPDVIWLSGANDDFTIEVNWKMDTDVGEGAEIRISLIGNATPIVFDVRGAANDKYRIHYSGKVKASGAFNPVAGTWYTARIRRVETTYYFRAHSALAEISWNYGTARAFNFVRLHMDNCKGDFDTFKYYWQYASEEGQYQLNEKRYLQFRVECTGAANITTDKYFAQLENLKLLTSDNEINAANILKDLLLNHTQKLELDTSLIQDCYNFKDIELCESLTGWAVSDATKLTLSLEGTIIKEGSKSIKTIAGEGIYIFPFSEDDGNWTLNDATISGGVLNINANMGYGQRSPDSNWLSGAYDDFILEIDFKLDSTGAGKCMILRIYLTGDASDVQFDTSPALMRIEYDGVVKASQAYINDTSWHTVKIRRVGTTFYFSIDGGAEISWDYGTARAINYFQLLMSGVGITGDYDNLKYSYISAKGEYLQKILSPIQNLQNKNLFRLWVRSTITGNILKAKFGENLRYQYEPDWSCQYQANQKPQDAEPIWTLAGTDYGSVADGILTINKVAANECSYKRIDIGHNVKGNTLLTKVKVSNAAKTTFLKILDGIAKVELAIYTTKIEDWNDAANVYTIDMTQYRELWLTMKNNFWVLYVDGTFALCGETQTTTDKWFIFGMDGSANLGKSYWDYVYYYNLGFLRNKRIEKTINIIGNVYEDDFAYDDGNWSLNNAVITGGVLDVVAISGYGRRSPNTDWNSGATDDFIIEFDFKQDSTPANYTMTSNITLIGDANYIGFFVAGSAHEMRIYYDGATKASQAFVDDINWHTAKIRRVGTVYYFSIDGGAEISWDYGTARAIDYIQLKMSWCTGEYDNFKYSYKSAWQEKIIDLNNFPIATRDAIKYIQFEVLTNDAFTFYIDWIRSNFELTSAYYRDRTAPLNILESVLAYQDYEWKINKDRKVEFFEVDRDEIDYICPIENLVFEENSVSYFNKIYLVYFDAMMKRQEIELIDEDSKIPFDKEHVIGLGGISDVGAKAIGEAQFSFHKKPRYQLSCSVEDFVFDKNGGRVNPIEIEPNNNVKFLGIATLPIFRIIKTDYSNGICRLTLETEEETLPNITKTIIGVL